MDNSGGLELVEILPLFRELQQFLESLANSPLIASDHDARNRFLQQIHEILDQAQNVSHRAPQDGAKTRNSDEYRKRPEKLSITNTSLPPLPGKAGGPTTPSHPNRGSRTRTSSPPRSPGDFQPASTSTPLKSRPPTVAELAHRDEDNNDENIYDSLDEETTVTQESKTPTILDTDQILDVEAKSLEGVKEYSGFIYRQEGLLKQKKARYWGIIYRCYLYLYESSTGIKCLHVIRLLDSTIEVTDKSIKITTSQPDSKKSIKHIMETENPNKAKTWGHALQIGSVRKVIERVSSDDGNNEYVDDDTDDDVKPNNRPPKPATTIDEFKTPTFQPDYDDETYDEPKPIFNRRTSVEAGNTPLIHSTTLDRPSLRTRPEMLPKPNMVQEAPVPNSRKIEVAVRREEGGRPEARNSQPTEVRPPILPKPRKSEESRRPDAAMDFKAQLEARFGGGSSGNSATSASYKRAGPPIPNKTKRPEVVVKPVTNELDAIFAKQKKRIENPAPEDTGAPGGTGAPGVGRAGGGGIGRIRGGRGDGGHSQVGSEKQPNSSLFNPDEGERTWHGSDVRARMEGAVDIIGTNNSFDEDSDGDGLYENDSDQQM